MTLISSGGRPRPKHSRALTRLCFGRGNHPAGWKAIGATDGASRCPFLAWDLIHLTSQLAGVFGRCYAHADLAQSSTREKGPHRVQPQHVRPPRAGSCGESGRELIGPIHQVIGLAGDTDLKRGSAETETQPGFNRGSVSVAATIRRYGRRLARPDGASRCPFLA